MKQFWTIYNFELKTYVGGKVFQVVTLIVVLALAVVLFWPKISALVTPDSVQDATDAGGENAVAGLLPTGGDLSIGIYAQGEDDMSKTLTLFADIMPMYSFVQLDTPVPPKAGVDDSYAARLIIQQDNSYQLYLQSNDMFDMLGGLVRQAMQDKYRVDYLLAQGLDYEQALSVIHAPDKGEIIQSGKDHLSTFIYSMAMLFLLYMGILLYGQFVASSVAKEKSNRAMELLITSAKTTNLMFGKVLGTATAGFLQIGVVLGASKLFYTLNRDAWADGSIIHSIFNMPMSILLLTCLFFVLGFLLYAFIYGALGSVVSRMEDLNNMVLPVTFLFVFAFMATVMPMSSGQTDTTFFKAMSFIPFTSPMAMYARIVTEQAEAWEVLVSILLLLVSIAGVAVLAAGIYRAGVLMYGNKPNLKSTIAMIRKQKSH